MVSRNSEGVDYQRAAESDNLKAKAAHTKQMSAANDVDFHGSSDAEV